MDEFGFVYTSRFYLDSSHPANAAGTVSSISYCFSVSDTNLPIYQATFGIYRRGLESYSLVSDTYTTSINSATLSKRVRYCQELQIIPVEIEIGDVFGACSVEFSDIAGNLQITAIGPIAKGRVMRSDDRSSTRRICPEVGAMASTVYDRELERRSSTLRMQSNITGRS